MLCSQLLDIRQSEPPPEQAWLPAVLVGQSKWLPLCAVSVLKLNFSFLAKSSTQPTDPKTKQIVEPDAVALKPVWVLARVVNSREIYFPGGK